MRPDDGNENDRVTAANVDLSNCDREVIHLPGLIQPHGLMVVLQIPGLVILQASENAEALFAIPVSELIGKPLSALLGADDATRVSDEIDHAGDRLDDGPFHLLQLPTLHDERLVDVMAHRVGDVLLLELELRSPTLARPYLLADVNAADARLRAATGLSEFLDAAVKQIAAASGFDRVMAYRFADDGSGEVVAEARHDGLTPYLGLHFPASDIPAPARRMFALSWLRHLPDVDYVPVRMFPETLAPVDMSRSLLRHVSVMYTSYLKNMRAHATLVMPLMKAGQLWGLISCMHHERPLHIPVETRTVLEMLALVVSLIMVEQEGHETAAYADRMRQAVIGLDRQMALEPVFYRGLSIGEYSLLGWLECCGAALATEEKVILFGATPTEEEIADLVGWLDKQQGSDREFTTDRLGTLYPAANGFQSAPRGLLAVRLARNRFDFVMWFRSEIVQTVHWAGDPNKPVQVDVVDGEARLSPRGSFDLWKETVVGRSKPWQRHEIEAASAFRQVLAEIMLVRLNEDLARSNTELDAFAYIAAHDLKEPLRGIHNYAHFLQRSAGTKLTDEENQRIETIIRLTRRMENLTDSLMLYAHIGRTELSVERVDLNELLRQTLDELDPRLIETGTVVVVQDNLPKVLSDRMRLSEVFSNLVINALKYNDRPHGEARLDIGWDGVDQRGSFYVRDNGIGIDPRHIEHVFEIFKRLHARHEYGGGSGAGLTITRRTIEKLGGRLWAESDGLGKGSTFRFNLGEGAIEPHGL